MPSWPIDLLLLLLLHGSHVVWRVEIGRLLDEKLAIIGGVNGRHVGRNGGSLVVVVLVADLRGVRVIIAAGPGDVLVTFADWLRLGGQVLVEFSVVDIFQRPGAQRVAHQLAGIHVRAGVTQILHAVMRMCRRRWHRIAHAYQKQKWSRKKQSGRSSEPAAMNSRSATRKLLMIFRNHLYHFLNIFFEKCWSRKNFREEKSVRLCN